MTVIEEMDVESKMRSVWSHTDRFHSEMSASVTIRNSTMFDNM